MIVQELTNAQGQFHNTVQERYRYFSPHELHGGAMTQPRKKKILPVQLCHSTVGAISASTRLLDSLIENTKQLISCHFNSNKCLFYFLNDLLMIFFLLPCEVLLAFFH